MCGRIFTVSPAINDPVDLCPNPWCNSTKETFFLGAIFFDFGICFIPPQNACFRFALCGRVTAFSPCIRSTLYKTLGEINNYVSNSLG